MSLSPGERSSPNPAKRQCLQQDNGDVSHQRTSDLRQELETTKDIIEVSYTV